MWIATVQDPVVPENVTDRACGRIHWHPTTNRMHHEMYWMNVYHPAYY